MHDTVGRARGLLYIHLPVVNGEENERILHSTQRILSLIRAIRS